MALAKNVGNHSSKAAIKERKNREATRKDLINSSNTWENLNKKQKDLLLKHLAVKAGLISDSEEQ